MAKIYLDGNLVPRSLHKSYYWSRRVFRIDRELDSEQSDIVWLNDEIEDLFARRQLKEAADLATETTKRYG